MMDLAPVSPELPYFTNLGDHLGTQIERKTTVAKRRACLDLGGGNRAR
jgi:hypothetical protein